MLLTTSLVLLLADTTATPLDSWVPRRMAELGIPAVAVTVVSTGHSAWSWWSGKENVLTRRPVSESTVWPVSDAVGTDRVSASPHATIAAILPPGLIVLSVWSVLLWILLIPLSLFVRRRWRFGRWHEILAILLAAPVTWIHLNRLTGPVLAAFFTGLGTAVMVVPVFGAALAWRKSRVSALLIVAAAAAVVWSARKFPLPIPAGASDAGATVKGLGDYLVSALESDSLELAGRGFTPDGSRWIRYDGGRGTHTFFVLVPARGTGVVAVANAGESGSLLREIVDSISQ